MPYKIKPENVYIVVFLMLALGAGLKFTAQQAYAYFVPVVEEVVVEAPAKPGISIRQA